MKTVKQLIEELSHLPQDLPVFFSDPGTREGEYHAVHSVAVDHIKNQNTDGSAIRTSSQPVTNQ
jgi:hypothetical protein